MYQRNYTFDINNQIDVFTLFLSHRNHKKYGRINNCKNIHFVDNIQPDHTLSFEVYKEIISEEKTVRCSVWDDIKDFRYIYVPELKEYFEIEVNIEDSNEIVKSITATNASVSELTNIRLRNIEINTENDIEREDYDLPTIFYDPEHPESSLLHRIFDKAKHYSIKHVDSSLAKIQRTFSISDTNIYDFCITTLSEEIGCLFVFSSADRTVSVYDMFNNCGDCANRGEFDDICPECGSANIINSYGENTNIFVSKENLAESITLTPNTEQIKNCLYISGGDDLITATVANCNPNGSNYIYYFSEDMYDDMSTELKDALQSYNIRYDELEPEYISIMSGLYELIDEELYLESEMMPDIEHAETNAQQQIALLSQSTLGNIAVIDVSKISLATANSAVLGMAKVIIDNDYKVEIVSSSLSSQIWTGNFKVTNRYEDTDTATGSMVSVTITDDYQQYVQQKIDKMFHKEDSDGLSDLLEIKDYNTFVSELKKYSLNRLISFESAYQSCLEILMEMDCANNETYPDLYNSLYLSYFNKLNAIEAEITIRANEIETIKLQINELENQKKYIQSQLDLETFLGKELYDEFLANLIEDEYSNDNYISDGLDNTQLFEMAQDLISTAKSEMIKNIKKNYSISVSLEDLLRIKEFRPLLDKFQCGNWFVCQVDDDIYKMRMLSYEIIFNESNGNILSVEFSNVTKTLSITETAKQIISSAQSMAKSFSYVSRQAKKGETANTTFYDLQKYGLNSSLFKIKNADTEDILIDNHGITCRAYDDIMEDYSPEQAAFIHNTLVFTDDNWRTARCSIGKHSYILDGKEHTDYGFNADSVISGTIIGGNIYSANYSDKNKTGTHINLTDGKFSFAGGKLIYDGSNLNLNGNINTSNITATGGTIGGSSLSSSGIFFNNGITGWGLWGTTAHANIAFHAGANTTNIGSAPFRVYHDGSIVANNLTSNNAKITGEISGSIIKSNGTVTKYAKDYSQADADRVKQILLGIIDATPADYEKYDFDGDGMLTLADQVVIKRFLEGYETSKTYDTSVTIYPNNTNTIIKTGEVVIGRSGITTKGLSSDKILVKQYGTYDDVVGEIYGKTGKFTADGKTITVNNGIITSIL